MLFLSKTAKKIISALIKPLPLLLVPFVLTSCSIMSNLADNFLPDISPDERISAPMFGELDETSETTAAETEPPEDVIKKSSFMGVGDNIIYYGNVRDAKKVAQDNGSSRTYDFKHSFSDLVPYIEAADIAFINQETLMCGEGYDFSYYPTFNGPQDMGYDLCELGFDVINIANNHMLDKGASGLEATIKFWKERVAESGVTMIGGYEDSSDYDNICVLESNGIKIAFLTFTYWTNGISISSSSSIVIPYMSEAEISSKIAAAKEISDFVIVSMHWDTENTFTPTSVQKNYAKLVADCGADVIIGHHPHVIQPIEWIEGKNGNKTLCVYSLGNIMAEQDHDYQMVGGIITFDIVQVNDEHPTVENVLFTPTVFDHTSNFYNNHIYIMENYTAEQAASHGLSAYGVYTSLDKLKGYVTSTIDKQFLPEYLQ